MADEMTINEKFNAEGYITGTSESLVKEGRIFFVTFNSFGHIAMRKEPNTEKKFPSPHEEFKGVF